MDTLHKDTLEALGFEVWDVASSERPKHYLYLKRGNKVYYKGYPLGSDATTEPARHHIAIARQIVTKGEVDKAVDKAWAQAPSLRDLREALESVMATERYDFSVFAYKGGYHAYLNDKWADMTVHNTLYDDDDSPASNEPFKTTTQAVVALFVKMCAEGLIDGKAVVL